jgi:hypothetical protein
MGCPQCYKIDEREAEDSAIKTANTCSRCKKPLKEVDKDYNGFPVLERVVMYFELGFECGNGSGDWERDSEDSHLCTDCYKEYKEWLKGEKK